MSKTTSVLQKLYRLISIRPRSEKEIRDYLQGKKRYSEEDIETAIKKLKQLGLLNDEEFAKAWVDARRRSKKMGQKALKQELYKKGISKEIIDQVLAGLADQQIDEKDLAMQALEKKLNSWKSLEASDFKKKAYGYLGRKGFEFEVISRVIEKHIKKEYNLKQ